METKNSSFIVLITLMSIFALSTSWASDTSRTFVLEPTAKHPEANGTAVIDDDHISLQARGLETEAVYTVWFVNMKPKKHEMGAGTAPFMFKTDRWGNGSYSAPLDKTPVGKWSMIMVVQHPNGDPRDMKNMVGALKATI